MIGHWGLGGVVCGKNAGAAVMRAPLELEDVHGGVVTRGSSGQGRSATKGAAVS